MKFNYIREKYYSVNNSVNKKGIIQITDIVSYLQYIAGINISKPVSLAIAITLFPLHRIKLNTNINLLKKYKSKSYFRNYNFYLQKAKHCSNFINANPGKIISVNNDVLRLKGLDIINKTPIINIMIYFTFLIKLKSR